MENKYDIIKVLDINDDFAIIYAKKKMNIQLKCKDCPHIVYNADVDAHYCSKHIGVVMPEDICIEEGM